jgi:ketosteroid isomerase-like protein
MTATDNKQTIQTMYTELAKGNLWKYLAPLADDVRLIIIGATKFSGTFTGKATYEKLLRDLTPLFDGRVILPRAQIRTQDAFSINGKTDDLALS